MGENIEMQKGDQLFVGDLVTFHGYHYTPDYLIIDEDKDGNLGIITEVRINSPIGTIAYSTYVLYTVFWFASGKKTTEVADHLRRISP
jgi:hypothetical protein